MTRAVRMTFKQTGNIVSGSTTFKSDGTLTGSSYGGPSNWILPTTGGIGASYWLRLTRLSGAPGVTFGALQDVWTNLGSDRVASAVGAAGGCYGTWEIASDSGGATIVNNGNLSVNNSL